MTADYHLHSEFSDDSTTPMQEQVKAALKAGLAEICFTDHVDYGIKTDWTDPAPMTWREGTPKANVNYPEYFAKLLRMRKTFEGQIRIRSGLEFGIQSHRIPQFEVLYETWKEELDFVLLSVHQVEDREFWNQDFQKNHTQREYNLRYYEEILSVMQHFDHYQVLAHLDLLTRYDPAGIYPFENVRAIVEEILKLAIRKGKGIELNTSSWRYGLTDTQPSRAILRLYHELGGKILTIGSDAHTPAYVGSFHREAVRILRDEIGFREFCTFEKGIPVFHALED